MTDEQKALEWASLRIRDIEKELDPRKDVFPPSKKTQLEYELDALRTIRTALEPQTVDVGFIYRWGQSLRIRAIDWKKYPKDAEVAVKSLVKDLGITVKEDK